MSEHAPQLFHPSRPAEREALQALLSDPARAPLVHDTLKAQVCELIASRTPEQKLSGAALQLAADALIASYGGDDFGCWALFPWRNVLVRLLPELEFAELRTSRNRYKITAEEQRRLAGATIGIVGLSAGNAIALCLALERIGGAFRLADYDALELSNMNRVASGVTALGVNKAVLTARQLYEIDPYLRIEVFERGVQPDNLSAFMAGSHPLDLLIEECDDLYMKVRLREEARARKIAVVMETNDRGLLDIERFDLEPERPVFHGLLAGAHSEELRGLDTQGKTPFMLRILGTDMSPRLAASLIEVDKTISGWPQLASGNMLGGAVVTDTARRILLGQSKRSGRFRLDLAQLIDGGLAAVPLAVAPAVPGEAEEPAFFVQNADFDVEKQLPPVAGDSASSAEDMAWLVQQATLAPSAGNDQPWLFESKDGQSLDCYLDREHSGSFLDFESSASYLALGAAAENATLAASELGREASLELFPEPSNPDLVFRLKVPEGARAVPVDPLARFIAARVTNRKLGERRPLAIEHARSLITAARQRGAELTLVTDARSLAEVGELLGKVDRFRFACERLHSAMLTELRFSQEQALATRDGIDVATLELDAVSMAGLQLLANHETAEFLRSLGKGVRLEQAAKKSIAAAGAVGLITIQGTDERAYFQAGRALQRIWLSATRLGLAFQPMSVAPYLFSRLSRGAGEGFTPAEIETLSDLRRRFAAVFEPKAGWAEALLFRLTHAPAPSARALRRPVSAILTEV